MRETFHSNKTANQTNASSGTSANGGAISRANDNKVQSVWKRDSVFAITWYAFVALFSGLALIIVFRAWNMDPRVAIYDMGDCLFVQVLAKATRAGWWFSIPELAAPFQLDLIDTGIACTVDYIVFKLIGLATHEPGLIVNLYLLASVMFSSISAAFCLRSLGVSKSISFVLAVLFALSPWTYWRNTGHVLLPLYLIPPTVLCAYHVLQGTFQSQRKELRWGLLASLFAVGFQHTYIPFFTAFLFLVILGFCAIRDWRGLSIRAAALGLGIVVLGTLLNLAPTLIYRARHGAIPEQKAIADSEMFGLKIRHLVTPILSHPFPPFRWAAEKINAAGFINENENRSDQLGTTGTIGFLLLLGYGLFVLIGTRSSELVPELRPLIFIVVVLIGLGTVGGFGTLFNVFITPSFRAYNRVAMFILFASLAAIGLALGRLTQVLGLKWRNPVLRKVLLVLWLVVGIADQMLPAGFIARYPTDRLNFAITRRMVRTIETSMAEGDAVFQLPHTEFIHENPPGTMSIYDNARPFLHSQKLRFSWGALTGRNGNWARNVAERRPREMIETLLLAGFAGIWVDTAGYPAAGAEIISGLSAETGVTPLRSMDTRYVFFDIRPLRTTWLRSLNSTAEAETLRQQVLHPVEILWDEGFYGAERAGNTSFHWSQPESVMELRNELNYPRRIELTMMAKGFFSAPLEITHPGGRQTIQVGPSETSLMIRLDVPAHGSQRLRFHLAGPPTLVPGDPRSLGFMVLNSAAREISSVKGNSATTGR